MSIIVGPRPRSPHTPLVDAFPEVDLRVRYLAEKQQGMAAGLEPTQHGLVEFVDLRWSRSRATGGTGAY